MLKVFQATDKTYSSNGDLIVNPLKAQVHKEDNGEFYLDLETPFNEKEVSIAKEEGTYTTITGSATIQNVSTSKLQEVLQLDGDTTQSGTPTPTSPQPINVVSGRQEVKVEGKNLFNKNTITSITNGTITNDVITSNAISSNYGGVSSTISGLTLEAGTYYISLKVKRDSGISGNKLTRITLVGIDTSQITMIDNPTITNEYQIYSCRISPATQITLTNIGIQLQPTNVNAVMSYTDIMVSKDNNTTYEAYKGQSYEINLGKNLINPNNAYTGTSNGITTTYNENQSLSFSGTTTGTWFYLTNKININLPSGDYTFSIDKTVSSHTVIIRMFYNATQYQDITINKNTTSRTVNVSNNTIAYQIYCGGITSGTQVNDTLFFQLEKGSVATSYAPYKTPIELCKIGTNQDFIKKGTGKNLFDKDSATSGKYYDDLGREANSGNWYIQQVTVKPSTNYYLSGNRYNNTNAYIVLLDSNKNLISVVGNYVNTHSITTTSNTAYIGLSIAYYSGAGDMNTIMLEEGQTATSYEPYGMYNKWYTEKQIGKVVLDGTETWNKNNDNRYYLSQYGRYFKYNGSTDEYVLMSDIAIKPTSSSSTSEYKIYNNWNGNIFINHLNIASEYTTSQWATAMAGHYIYGVLTTPTYTEITDEELLTQINSIKLIEGLNNVSITSADLTAPIYIHYNYIDEVSYSIKYNDYLIPNNIIVANTPQGEQAFRISNVEKTRRKIKIKANHVFYDSANLLIQDSYVVDKNCNDALDHLNNATSDLSPFTTISNINVIDSYRCVRKSLFQAIQVVIERWGGHLVRDNWTIGVYDTIGQDNGVTIRYAKNLKDITATYIWDDVVTKLLPVGKDGILLNELDPTASVYVESAVKYDIPYTKTISFEQNSIIEDDYKDENGTLILEDYKQALIDDLYAQATEYITNNYLPKVNYTLSANVEKISDIGDTIEVIDEKLGINIMTNVISYDYDCILDKYIEIEFGNFTPELSNLMNSITENTERIVREENSTLAITLGRELEEATDKIWSALGNSYVIYDGDKILVVDSLPKETATNVIMINNGGIGFSNTGITGTFSSAWTIDNVLNMENINVINLTADLIKGGTLKLGSNLNQNGQIEVYDEANSLIAELNKNGLKMYGVDGSYVLMNNQVGFAGYDRNDNPIYWVNGDEFHMKKSVVEEEITLVNKMRIIPITIRDGNNQIVNDGIGFVNVAN